MNAPLFLQQSVSDSIELLRMMEPKEGYYLAFSGGKDSIVLYRLAELAGVRFDAHYNITTADPPELVRFIRDTYPTVHRDRASETMWTLIPRKLMPPTRLARYCCEVLKERGGEGRVVLTGIRSAESTKRKHRRQVEPCNRKGKTLIHPILRWTDSEVWSFVRSQGLAYCVLYDRGYKRLGCVGCPMSYNKRCELDAYPKIKAAYLRAFDRMLEERKKRGLVTTRWETAEDVMEWWLSE